MNILLINHYAGSNIHGMEYRPFYLAREWVRLGHKVTIVAATFSHLRNSEPNTKEPISEEEIEDINYIWLKTPRYQGNGIGRVINMAAFSLRLFTAGIAKKFKPDIVIASSPHPFIIFGAKRIASASNAKLLFEVRDLWPLTLTELGNMSKWHPFVMLMQFTENFAYRASDRIISVLPKADIYMKDHGMSEGKFFYLPNGLDVDEWERSKSSALPEIHDVQMQQLKKQDRFIVCYAGAHGISNALHFLIDAAALLRDLPVVIVLVGQGPEKEALQKRVSELGLENIIFLPPVPKTAIPCLFDLMDVLYIGWQKKSLYQFGISPNKLLDYMMSGKPIIHSIEAGNDMVAESGCGISVLPEDPDAISNAVIKLMNMTPDKRREMGLRGREHVLRNNDYRVLAKRLIELILSHPNLSPPLEKGGRGDLNSR